ncbi:MAG: Virginiamycin B lyase, partial [Candidatus Eremiobacteraeota bacterium]|nr:Virginiamycin B lyase [Candidatus Eremiobacteraeota bacterium]
WFTECAGNKIGSISTDGVTINEYTGLSLSSDPQNIAAGPDNAVWFTELADRIGRITTGGTVHEYPLTLGSQPFGITPGYDSALWFTEPGTNKIGRITTTGTITEYPIPTAFSDVQFIYPSPDGSLWFTEYYGNKLGRIQ